MQHLSALVGESWLEAVRNASPPRVHPLHYKLVRQGEPWEQWRRSFDDAVGLVAALVKDDVAAQKRLIAKIKDPRQFGATLPEVVWGARFVRMGAKVVVEPIVGRPGPDFQFTIGGISAHAEVYSPVFKADEFEWGSDLDNALSPLGFGVTVSAQVLPDRRSENLKTVSSKLKRTLKQLASANDDTRYRLYVWQDHASQLEVQPEYVVVEDDPVLAAKGGAFFVADVQYAPHWGGPVIETHVSNASRDMASLVSGLGQLQPGANVLILDAAREFVNTTRLKLECLAPGGVFERRPELSAVVVSHWGVYTNPLTAGEAFAEEYEVIASPNAAVPFPPPLLVALSK